MVSVLLIGGTSHSGKTTLGAAVAERLGWELCSTDYLARHPGRPWRDDGTPVPPHVIEHFTTLSIDELMSDVLRHYRSVWPQAENLIRQSPDGIVVEGSAVLPELAAKLDPDFAKAVWLVGKERTFRDRIYRASNISSTAGLHRAAIEMFALRGKRFNSFIANEVRRLGLHSLSTANDLETQLEEVFALMK